MLFIIQFTLFFILVKSFYIGEPQNDFNSGSPQQPSPIVGGANVVPIPLSDSERNCLEKKDLPTFTVNCVPDTLPAKCSEQDYNNLKTKMQSCSLF
ncbi:unnamed protein product [Meloidogyne enterolobii]|uniref:Uncharacterized protein n=2 Tax=Meloidogyne enterolobii TaxID=390850 RepID=A0A6V7X4H3_MELEN|nr:unnamed protein product [Meloidogyne enterolobii]